jgi:hypothetical protein
MWSGREVPFLRAALPPSGLTEVIYCDEPLLRNGRFSADVIAMATNTENQPITRNG